MNAVNLLLEDSREQRTYRTSSVYRRWLRDYQSSFEEAFPDQDWQDSMRLLSEDEPGKYNPLDGPTYDISVKHMVRWGCGDASILEKRWNIVLPEWFLLFYSKVETAVLTWRNMFYLLHPQSIILVEEEHRDWHDNKSAAVRLIRFAEVWGAGDYLALRQSTKDQKWRVMYVSHEESTAIFKTLRWTEAKMMRISMHG